MEWTLPLFSLGSTHELSKKGLIRMMIIGVDEVGRGPLAGPVVAAATAFDANTCPKEFTDSKKLSKKKREELFEEIKRLALNWSIVAIGPRTIDSINIREASKLAMSIAVAALDGNDNGSEEVVLVDGNMPIETSKKQTTVIKGDSLHNEIGAASILAKVWRDRKMAELGEQYPGYDFESHAGYPTKTHKASIAKNGPCKWHRSCFSGVKEFWDRKLEQVTTEELQILTKDNETTSFKKPSFSRLMGRAAGKALSPRKQTQDNSYKLAV